MTKLSGSAHGFYYKLSVVQIIVRQTIKYIIPKKDYYHFFCIKHMFWRVKEASQGDVSFYAPKTYVMKDSF